MEHSIINIFYRLNHLTSANNIQKIKFNLTQVSQKWRTDGAPRCRRDYRKRQKNVKQIQLARRINNASHNTLR
jgi:hypothetical protein